MTTQPKEFNKFQQLVWPIHNYELKKFLPMSFLMGFILFVYTLVRDMKDIFVQLHTNMWAGAGKVESAQLLSALKVWYVLPSAFIAVAIFGFLINKFGSKKTFYIMVSAFMAFYAIFGFIIYPNLDSLIMSTKDITAMTEAAPSFFRTFLTALGNWPVSLFYIFSEIWGTIAVSSLFWQFANATTMKSEVKRFFGLFSLIGNIGVILAGTTIKTALGKASVPTVRAFMIAVLCCGGAAILTYWYLNERVLKDPRYFDASQIKVKKKKGKVSALEGIKILFKDSYLRLIAVLVMGYGVSINFSESIMKAYMKEAFPTNEAYSSMQGNISIFTGIFTICITFFGAYVLRKFKWKTVAVITPLVFLTAGGLFFLVALYKKFSPSKEILGISALSLAVWLGVIQDALVKSVKYSLFDPTKNMAYLPLDEETKTKGQAAVEVIGGRAGKAGASVAQQIMFAFSPKILDHVVTIAILFITMVVSWIYAVFGLNKKYEAALKKEEK